jgi:hypothetical protein
MRTLKVSKQFCPSLIASPNIAKEEEVMAFDLERQASKEAKKSGWMYTFSEKQYTFSSS